MCKGEVGLSINIPLGKTSLNPRWTWIPLLYVLRALSSPVIMHFALMLKDPSQLVRYKCEISISVSF